MGLFYYLCSMIEDKDKLIRDIVFGLDCLLAKYKKEHGLQQLHQYEPGGIIVAPYKQKSGEMVRPATEQELKIFEMIKKMKE